jgi:Outer membrane protein beta-barrel domain
MKKQILLLSALFISGFAFSQTQPSFGIRAGVSSSNIKGDVSNSLNDILEYTNGMVTTNNKTGVYAGVYTNIPLSNIVSVEPGINYTQRGYEMKGELGIKGAEFLGANAKVQLNQHYVDLPVVLKLNMDGLQLFAGPQVSYLVKSDLKTTAGVLGFNLLNESFDATNQFNSWDAGFTAGLGYQFNNGLNISAAYDHGFSRIDANQNFDAYNRSFKLGLGLNF